MQELVCDMLDLAKPETTKTESQNFERVDLSELVQGDVLQFESVAFERNISLSPEIDANVNVCGISARLHRLVSTLLDNACKYANEGGEVDVCLHQSVRAITLSIHNSGESIPQADLPHIFDRFYRADKARTNSNDAKSYGLGLAIAREIALEHKGSIEVSSNEGEGTTFIVKFPTNQ